MNQFRGRLVSRNKMAAEVDDDDPLLSQNSDFSSFRSFRQTGFHRRRPSKRQTTLRSFKIKPSWNTDGSSQAIPASLSQGSSNDLPVTQELSTIPPSPEQLCVDTSENPTSPVLEPLSGSPSDAANQLSDCIQLAPLTRSRSHEESPSSIVLESEPAQLQTGKESNTDRTPSPSSQKPPLEKTPLSGPGALKTKRGRKRKIDDAKSLVNEDKDSLENEYQENNFVRLFNADHGRKSGMSEITDLDVVLTAIEEEALEIRSEIQSSDGRQAIKELFIRMRKSFSETIDVYRENNMLTSDLRKAKSRINKLRKALLGIQQKRSRISAKLEKVNLNWKERSQRREALEDFSSFLVKLEALQKECRKDVSSKKASKLDYGTLSNLPSLLIEGHGLLTAANHLKHVNDSLQKS